MAWAVLAHNLWWVCASEVEGVGERFIESSLAEALLPLVIVPFTRGRGDQRARVASISAAFYPGLYSIPKTGCGFGDGFPQKPKWTCSVFCKRYTRHPVNRCLVYRLRSTCGSVNCTRMREPLSQALESWLIFFRSNALSRVSCKA